MNSIKEFFRILRDYLKTLNMSSHKKINLINILLGIVAVVMIILGIQNKLLPPALTGVGFFLIIWALNILKKKD